MIRSKLVAIVSGLSALSGAVAGAVSMLVAAAVLTPTEPVTASQIAMMVVESGVMFGVAGAVIGTIASFGFLRRVPLGRLVLWTNLGTTAGLVAGWVGGPWAWHHFELMGLTGFALGAMLARVSSGSGRPAAVARATVGTRDDQPPIAAGVSKPTTTAL